MKIPILMILIVLLTLVACDRVKPLTHKEHITVTVTSPGTTITRTTFEERQATPASEHHSPPKTTSTIFEERQATPASEHHSPPKTTSSSSILVSSKHATVQTHSVVTIQTQPAVSSTVGRPRMASKVSSGPELAGSSLATSHHAEPSRTLAASKLSSKKLVVGSSSSSPSSKTTKASSTTHSMPAASNGAGSALRPCMAVAVAGVVAVAAAAA